MKKIIILILTLSVQSCFSQNIKNISVNTEMNYVFARIYEKKTIVKELFNRGLFVTIYELSDSKITSKDNLEDFLSSYIVSVVPDGDYYSDSKLYKIEGLLNPTILDIKEGEFPNFRIKIEYGSYNKRKRKSFEFEGVQ